MTSEALLNYIATLPNALEDMPFGDNTLVYKVGGKMFLLVDINNFESINVKCDPEYAISLRESYTGIVPGFHMNKKHWNTVSLKEDVPDALLKKLIQHSYDLVYKSLPKKVKDSLENHGN